MAPPTIEALSLPFIAIGARHGIEIVKDSSNRRRYKIGFPNRHNVMLTFTASKNSVLISYTVSLLICGSGIENVEPWSKRPAGFSARLKTDIHDGSVYVDEEGFYEGNVQEALQHFDALCTSVA